MSTDLRDRTTHPSPDDGGGAEKPKSSLSFTQVVGGALAAMTAAALGSRLSLAGTVVGAALASVVAAVAGAVYTASLRRTTKHVTKVIQKTRTHPGDAGAPTSAAADAPVRPVWADPAQPVDERDPSTRVLPAAGTDAATATAQPARRPIGWKPVLVGALLMFVIAALALTGIELATGHALSGGNGTTVGQVAEGRPTPSARPSASQASASPSATPTPSATPSATPSSEPSATPSTSASATPTPTATPSLPTAVPSVATTP